MEYNAKFDKKPTIIFISTELKNNVENHLLFMASTAKKLGHNVIIVTSDIDETIFKNATDSLKVYKIGSLIPTTIYGKFYKLFNFFRSLYSSIWILKHKKELNPSFVVVQNGGAIVPFLKIIGNLRVIQLQTFPELDSNKKHPEDIITTNRLFYKFFMKHADEIVVINKLSRNIFKQVYSETKPLSILYPCVDTREFQSCLEVPLSSIIRIPDDSIYFITLGPILESANLELAIESFSKLLDDIRFTKPYLYSKLYYIIAGSYGQTLEHIRYCTKLQLFALRICKRPCILFLNKFCLLTRKTLMKYCEGIILPMEDNFDSHIILEAGYMKKPVLALKSGIALELIRDGVNGYLLPNNVADFAKCMYTLVHSKHFKTERAKRIHLHFKKNYSLIKYSSDLEIIVNRNKNDKN